MSEKDLISEVVKVIVNNIIYDDENNQYLIPQEKIKYLANLIKPDDRKPITDDFLFSSSYSIVI